MRRLTAGRARALTTALAFTGTARALTTALAAAALLVAPRVGLAQAPRASAPLDTLRVPGDIRPAVVKVGERVRVRLAVRLPDHASRLVGPPAPESFGAVDVLASSPVPAGVDSAAWALEVALFEPGDQDLTGLPFLLQSPTGDRPVRLLTYTITVESTLSDTAQDAEIRDIRGPVTVPLRWRWVRVVGALLALALIGVAIVFWRRRRVAPPAEVPVFVPVVDPEEAALRALRDLERERLPARGLLKEHYFRLSLVLRTYLERRFAFPAVESTTDEIRTVLQRGRMLGARDGEEALALFEEADLVKFARFDPGAGAGDAALERGRAWVERVAAVPRAGGER